MTTSEGRDADNSDSRKPFLILFYFLCRFFGIFFLFSGPAVRADQILILSYSFVFLPLMSTAVRTSVLSFVGALNDLLYIP